MNEDLRQEFETHLALIEEEERAKGLSAEQARDQARARFGNSLAYRERALDAVIATWLENTCKEMIFAARRLGWSPAFTLATGLTLAIGANAAIFYGGISRPLSEADFWHSRDAVPRRRAASGTHVGSLVSLEARTRRVTGRGRTNGWSHGSSRRLRHVTADCVGARFSRTVMY
jgi:hypothetical protein